MSLSFTFYFNGVFLTPKFPKHPASYDPGCVDKYSAFISFCDVIWTDSIS